jgi:hypothetical protein
MLDGAVLARGIHRLEDDQQRPAPLGIEALLELGEPLDPLLQEICRGVAVEGKTEGIGRIDLLQAEMPAFLDLEGIDQLGELQGRWPSSGAVMRCFRP